MKAAATSGHYHAASGSTPINGNNQHRDSDESCLPQQQEQRCSLTASTNTQDHPVTATTTTTTANGSRRHKSSSTTTTSTSTHLGHMFNRASILVSLRAAVLLLPLYGLHYLVIVYRPRIE